MNQFINKIKNFKIKNPESLGRYYINDSYLKWNYNVNGTVLEIGAGKNEKYTKNSITVDINNIFDPHVLANGYCLPFDNNVFDTVIAVEVLEHLEKPQSFIDEIHRVLRPDGKFFLTTRFIHQIHGSYDYFRYTKLSLSTIFRNFRTVHIEEQGSVLSVLLHFILVIFSLPLCYNILSLFYPFIKKIDKYGRKSVTLGYTIYGKK